MRTTVALTDDVTAAVEERMHRHQVGLSQALNDLVRAGLSNAPPESTYEPPTYPMGVLDLLAQWDEEERQAGDG